MGKKKKKEKKKGLIGLIVGIAHNHLQRNIEQVSQGTDKDRN